MPNEGDLIGDACSDGADAVSAVFLPPPRGPKDFMCTTDRVLESTVWHGQEVIDHLQTLGYENFPVLRGTTQLNFGTKLDCGDFSGMMNMALDIAAPDYERTVTVSTTTTTITATATAALLPLFQCDR